MACGAEDYLGWNITNAHRAVYMVDGSGVPSPVNATIETTPGTCTISFPDYVGPFIPCERRGDLPPFDMTHRQMLATAAAMKLRK